MFYCVLLDHINLSDVQSKHVVINVDTMYVKFSTPIRFYHGGRFNYIIN